MRTIRRFIYREVVVSVAFVTLAFLALFFFFDLVDELRWVGRLGMGYQLTHALLFVALGLPQHLYELLPITVLIGTIFVMARLAQSSEFTIMRTSGLGPWRALSTLLLLGGVVGAQWGARMSGRFRAEEMRAALGFIVLGVGLYMGLELFVRPSDLFQLAPGVGN